MKLAKQLFSLMLATVLVFSLLNTPAPAVESVAGIVAVPVQYALSIDGGERVSLWAYEIDGGVYFKLRDLAMALNGTDKQFDLTWWTDEHKEVDLLPGEAYTPVGGELSKPDRIENAKARYTDYSIRSVSGWGNILAYLVDGTNYVKLSDLAAVLKFASGCNKDSRTAEIDTSPEIGPAGGTGDAFDNIALSSVGNSYSLDEDGNVILYYKNSEIKSKAPLVLQPPGSDYKSGQSVDDAGFYISEEKTAIAYGGLDGEPVYVITSEDMGKTWEKSEVIARNVGTSQPYIGFNTPDNGWLVICNFHGMGHEDHYIYRTVDGGKTWSQIGNPNDIYSRVLTGAGFATDQIGFLSFRYETDFQPAILRTPDGGYTWEKLYVTLPEEFDDYNKTPLSPVFNGADGLFPIKLSNGDGDYATIYLKSTDYGKTWTYDEAYNLAQMWAQAVQNRDGRTQYKLMSAEVKTEYEEYYNACNWVTGVSSPWVESYTVEMSGSGAVVTYELLTSSGPAEYGRDILTFSDENGVWRISGLKGYNANSGYNVRKNAVELQFKTEALAYKKLPVLDETQVSEVLKERTENGITQALYRKEGDDWQYYSYLTIGGVNYDLGYMGYGMVDDSTLGRWGIEKTQISEDIPVYMFVRLNGADYVSSAYLTVMDSVPYLLYEFDGWGIQYDIDKDGEIETTANAGVSTSPYYILYEWDINNKSIRYARLTEALNCDTVAYLSDKNLFYASSRNEDTGGYDTPLAFAYKTGTLVRMEGD